MSRLTFLLALEISLIPTLREECRIYEIASITVRLLLRFIRPEWFQEPITFSLHLEQIQSNGWTKLHNINLTTIILTNSIFSVSTTAVNTLNSLHWLLCVTLIMQPRPTRSFSAEQIIWELYFVFRWDRLCHSSGRAGDPIWLELHPHLLRGPLQPRLPPPPAGHPGGGLQSQQAESGLPSPRPVTVTVAVCQDSRRSSLVFHSLPGPGHAQLSSPALHHRAPPPLQPAAAAVQHQGDTGPQIIIISHLVSLASFQSMVNSLSQMKSWLHSNSPNIAYFTISCH